MSRAAVKIVDATLRDLGAPPWGARLDTEDLAVAAAALAPVGAMALEVLDPPAAHAVLEGRAESPWDRVRAVVRRAGTVPVGIVLASRTLLGDHPLGPDAGRALVLGACEGGVRRVRVLDPMNDAESLVSLAEGAREGGAAFVPTLVVGPAPAAGDPRWLREAAALAALPAASALCIADEGGHLPPAALGGLVQAVAGATGLPVEVALRAPGGLASMSAMAAVAAGAASLHASVGAVALVSGRPSASALRAALAGGPGESALDRDALEVAGRVLWPLVGAERVRQAAALAGGPTLSLPPDLAGGLAVRLGRQGMLSRVREGADEAARVAEDLGAVTLAPPLGASIVAQAARHLTEGRRWADIPPELAEVALGRRGRLRGPVDPGALAAAEDAAGHEPREPDLAAILAAAPAGLSEEDVLLLAQFPEAGQRLAARRRSLSAESADEAGVAIDRGLLETLVEVVEGASQAEVSVEVGGARVTVRRAGPAPERADAPAGAPDDGAVRIESPMVGTFYRAPTPDADPFVKEGDQVVQGQTLCIIEAMKIFNEIVAERGGVVREVCAANAEAVEYGQLLFVLAP